MKKQTLIRIGCLLTLAPTLALANIIPTGTTISGTGPYVWSYNLQLSQDQNAKSGPAPTTNPVSHLDLTIASMFTIYDFAGYVAGSCSGPTGWACTAQNVGFTPDDVVPTDDASIINLTWAYVSGPLLEGSPRGLDLGTFSASSQFDTIHTVSYTGRGVRNDGSQAGSIGDNVGLTQGPMMSNLVPEPGSLALAGLGLVGLALRRRGKGSATAA